MNVPRQLRSASGKLNRTPGSLPAQSLHITQTLNEFCLFTLQTEPSKQPEAQLSSSPLLQELGLCNTFLEIVCRPASFYPDFFLPFIAKVFIIPKHLLYLLYSPFTFFISLTINIPFYRVTGTSRQHKANHVNFPTVLLAPRTVLPESQAVTSNTNHMLKSINKVVLLVTSSVAFTKQEKGNPRMERLILLHSLRGYRPSWWGVAGGSCHSCCYKM